MKARGVYHVTLQRLGFDCNESPKYRLSGL